MNEKATLFNLVWINNESIERKDDRRHIVSKRFADAGAVQTVNFQLDVNCMILYPSLVVPQIVWGEEYIEVVMIGREHISDDELDEHLRFSPGLDKEKNYYDCKLSDKIGLDEIVLSDQRCHLVEGMPKIAFPGGGRFGGNLHKDALEAIIDYSQDIDPMKYEHITYVKIPAKILRMFSDSDPKVRLNVREQGKGRYGLEEQDLHIFDQMTKLNGKKIKGKGRWCFKVGAKDVNPYKTDWDDPVQSYHPIFYYDNFDSASFCVLADTHLSARQKILKRSNARVIEYPDASKTNGEIGDKVNICSANTKAILDKAGKDVNVDVVLVAGDLIDFIMNAYRADYKHGSSKMNAKDVWDQVKLSLLSKNKNYQDFVDLVSFYSLIVYFYRKYKKPIYIVSGNHDCYYEAFGISPRLGPVRTNAGIAADHNLTFYEAILAFGNSYGTLLKPGMPFNPKKFIWFYTALTPFHDFAVKWPKQTLIGFGWGNTEDVFVDPIEGQGTGHLGRSEDAITDDQLELLERFVDSSKKNIVLSHFTFASFAGGLPMSPTPEGYLECAASDKHQYGDYDFGTFEKNRMALIKKHLHDNKDIQCTISGHSHRRGIYTVGSMYQKTKVKPGPEVQVYTLHRLKTKLYDFNQFSKLHPKRPLMIVSDSSGSIPRYNKYGEFSGWGSYPASGVKIATDSNADITNIQVIQGGKKARFPVVMEYLDIENNQRVIKQFARHKLSGKPYKFHVELNEHLPKSVAIRHIVLYSYVGDRNDGIAQSADWFRIELIPSSQDFWEIKGGDEDRFDYIRKNIPKSRGNFISIEFQSSSKYLNGLYDFGDAWEREFQIEETNQFLLSITMDPGHAEIPDFAWRHKHFNDKY